MQEILLEDRGGDELRAYRGLSNPDGLEQFESSGSGGSLTVLELMDKAGVAAEEEAEAEAVLGWWLACFCLTLFLRRVCQTFFISLSVRPGNFATIADHLFPSISCNLMMVSSSSELKLPLFMSGLK